MTFFYFFNIKYNFCARTRVFITGMDEAEEMETGIVEVRIERDPGRT